MKISIKTKDIQIEYEDGYSKLEEEVTKRIITIIKEIPKPTHQCKYCGGQDKGQ